MLPRGLKLFIADIVDEETQEQEDWYVVGKTYDSAFKKFVKEANKCWYRYSYYFYEVEDNSVIAEFIEYYDDIKAGIYDK